MVGNVTRYLRLDPRQMPFPGVERSSDALVAAWDRAINEADEQYSRLSVSPSLPVPSAQHALIDVVQHNLLTYVDASLSPPDTDADRALLLQ